MLIICMIFRITISIAGCMAYKKIIRFCKTFWKLYYIPIENEIIDQMYFEILLKVNMIKVQFNITFTCTCTKVENKNVDNVSFLSTFFIKVIINTIIFALTHF